METPRLVVPDVIDESFVQSSFVAATEYLNSTVSYIWKNAKDDGQMSKYSIGTWSRKIARSEILKNGTAEDKAGFLQVQLVTRQMEGSKVAGVFKELELGGWQGGQE